MASDGAVGKGSARLSIAIVGVGNPLVADDGVGPAVLESLEGRELPEGARLVEAGTDPLSLAYLLAPEDRVILVDAVKTGKPPGTVTVFSPEQASLAVAASPSSLHGFGLAEALKLMELSGRSHDITIVGIEPEDLRPGKPMTPAVQAAVSKAAEIVLGEAGNIGRSHARQTACPPPRP